MKIYIKDPTKFNELIIRNGHTKTSFSIELGVHRSYIYQITAGQSLSPILANKICDKLNVNFDDIFFIGLITKVI